MTAKRSGQFHLDPQSATADWLRTLGALALVTAVVVAGHIVWKRVQPSPYSDRLATSPSQPQRQETILDVARQANSPIQPSR
jgi:hypothetical protein